MGPGVPLRSTPGCGLSHLRGFWDGGLGGGRPTVAGHQWGRKRGGFLACGVARCRTSGRGACGDGGGEGRGRRTRRGRVPTRELGGGDGELGEGGGSGHDTAAAEFVEGGLAGADVGVHLIEHCRFALASPGRFCDGRFAVADRGKIPGKTRRQNDLLPQIQTFQGNLVNFYLERWQRVRICAPLHRYSRWARPEPPWKTVERLFMGPKVFSHQENGPEEKHMTMREQFISQLKLSINQKFAEILAANQAKEEAKKQQASDGKKRQKDEDPAVLSMLDAATITNYVRAVFAQRLGVVPAPVEAACVLSEATVAPSTIMRIKLIKRAIGIGGGLAGLGIIAGTIMVALGVGTVATAPTIWATIVAYFTTTTLSTPVLGPLAVALFGAGVAGIAVYFAASGNSAERAEKFRKALIDSCEKAVEQCWDEFGDKLSAGIRQS